MSGPGPEGHPSGRPCRLFLTTSCVFSRCGITTKLSAAQKQGFNGPKVEKTHIGSPEGRIVVLWTAEKSSYGTNEGPVIVLWSAQDDS